MSDDLASTSLSSRDRRAFVLRKLHSLTGVIPVGIYLSLHIFTNAKAMEGAQAYDEAVAGLARWPYWSVVEVVGLYLPLAFHALYGVKLTLEARPNNRRYPFSRNWMYTLQRVTGLLALGFIAYHLWHLRAQVGLGTMERADYFPRLCATLSSTTASGIPVAAIAYLIGVAACVFHFANGLHGFCFSWGITVSRRAARSTALVFGLFGVALFAVAASTIIYFATGSRLVLAPGAASGAPPPITCRDLTAGSLAAVVR
ncbi:MAG: succinate dehydrogenase cytochrome b558 subunit [Sorangiineae bacterium]|nr:succinate dehydrogenase cytochrome b558 subunit [Polyangiaceae bacterium]MEB2324550.1 succinate dehydrogenase cytochrome b558 subunit [Sorangiineae bacterium]